MAGRVVGIDLSPEMTRLARECCAGHDNVDIRIGDFMSLDWGDERFDCIFAVAVLHHLPLIHAVERIKDLLEDGGTLVIMDLVANAGIRDLVLGGAAWLIRGLESLGRPRNPELERAWSEHGCGERYETMSRIRRCCRVALPGAKIRRHLFWRYSVVWEEAGATAAETAS
jgi:SAM-dependent methyltransferase